MMRDIKIMTRGFQDASVAEFLNGVPGVTMTAAQLKKLRNRHTQRAAAWTPPRYVSRPASRIVLDTNPPPPAHESAVKGPSATMNE
jgi:hypothetical protein